MDDTTSELANEPTDPVDEMTDEEKRRDQLLRAAGAVEADAAPRIEVTRHGDVTRVDIAPDAAVRPGPVQEDGEETTP
jgi:hypothetical protein